MSPRPRQTSDEAIYQAASRAMSRFGPDKLTLAHIAAEAGIAPATLVQRFGSKRGLLLTLARQVTMGDEYAAIRAAHTSPLAGLFAVADCMAGMAPTPEALANHLAYLHVDLTDPDFHEVTQKLSRIARAEVRTFLDAAVKAGELAPCDTERLARAVQVTLGGGLLAWAIERKGTAAEWVRYDLETLLGPYRKQGKTASRNRRRPGNKKVQKQSG